MWERILIFSWLAPLSCEDRIMHFIDAQYPSTKLVSIEQRIGKPGISSNMESNLEEGLMTNKRFDDSTGASSSNDSILRYFHGGGASLAAYADVRPRLLYEQRRCQVCVPPLATIAAAVTFVTLGLSLALPQSAFAHELRDRDNFRRHDSVILGAAFLLLGLLLPGAVLWACLCVATPSRKRRQREAVVADAMLEEMLAGQAIMQHYDVMQPVAAGGRHWGPSGADGGPPPPSAPATVILLAGAGAPRIVSHQLAHMLAHMPPPAVAEDGSALPRTVTGFKTVCVDLPGHGSLVSVGFSLARCERVLRAVIQRELLRSRAVAAKHATTVPTGWSAASQGEGLFQGPQGSPSTPDWRHGGLSDADEVLFATKAAAASVAAPLESVVIVAYGVSSCVATHFAARNPSLVAGLVFLGSGPQRHTRSAWFGCLSRTRAYNTGAGVNPTSSLEGLNPTAERRSACGPGSIYRLRWAAALSNLSVKSRVQANAHATEELRSELLAHDWHVGVLPEYLAAIHATGPALLSAVRSMHCPVLMLAPAKALDRLRGTLSADNVVLKQAKGVKHDMIPSLNPDKVGAMARSIAEFSPAAFAAAGYNSAAAAMQAVERTRMSDAASPDTGASQDARTSSGAGGRAASSGSQLTGSFATTSGSISASAAASERRRHMSRRGLSMGGLTTGTQDSLGGSSSLRGATPGAIMAAFLGGRRSHTSGGVTGSSVGMSSYDEGDAYAALSSPSYSYRQAGGSLVSAAVMTSAGDPPDPTSPPLAPIALDLQRVD